MRKTIICIVLASVSACSGEEAPVEPVDETEEDPACAGGDVPAARADGELPWDLERDPVADASVCPDDNPGCDRLEELDAPDPEPDDIELHGATLDDVDVTTYGLADGLTSSGKYRVWPNGRIPYRIDTSVSSTTRERLSQAMTNWEQLTEGRIKFRAKQSTDTAYVVVREGSPKVSPHVGYRKDKISNMYLRDGEYLTVIKHELGHVIGMHHEQRRSDRLSFIKVRNQYIVDSDTCRYQFSTCSTCKKVGNYDRISVMHYRTHDLPGCRTGNVLLKLDGSAINHTWKVSAKDLTTVATMYAKPASPPPPPPQPMPLLPESGSIVGEQLCTSIADRGMVEGQAVEVRTCDGGGDQDWRLTADGQLRVQHSLQCAAVVGCSVEGAAVEQSTCAPGALDQKWTFEEMSIVSGKTSKCLEARDSGVALAACTNADEQLFQYRPETETIVNGELCATASDNAITLAACDGSEAQKWFQGRGGFVTRTNTSRCLNATDTGVTLAACTDDVEQRWALRGSIQDGRSALCLQGGTAAGTKLALAACDGSSSQLWTLWSR